MTGSAPSDEAVSNEELLRIDGPLAWYGPEMAARTDWIHHFSATELAELERAVEGVAATPILDIDRERFALPTLGPTLQQLQREVMDGRGFVLLRGISVEHYSLEQAARLYFGLGQWLGEPISQNPEGHMLGHVKDIGARVDNPNQRGYQSPDALPFHNDVAGDMVALFCLRPARSGGLSSIVSGTTLYNELLERDPALVRALMEPLFWDRRGEVPPGKQPWYQLPVFAHHRGHLLIALVRRFIESAQRFEQVPRLSPTVQRALQEMAEIAASDRVHLSMDFRPGDIQVINNLATLHSRTGYTDFEDPDRRRHLLRLWLVAGNAWALPDPYFERYTTRARCGRPAGIMLDGTRPSAPLDVT